MTLGTVAGADLCMLYERAQRARQEIAAAITGGSAECWQVERLRGVIDQGDGSWLVFDRQRGAVTQGGPRRLWDEVERLFDAWCALGAPNRDRFGLTVHPDGRHVLWLDDPDGEHHWEVRR